MVSILLASYNGEKYIAQQLDSILAQTYEEFVVHVSDDGSTDGTPEIVADYARRYPDKIYIVRNDENSGSAKHNFLKLMTTVRDRYLMLCDQDDVWLPDKIADTLEKMQAVEAAHGQDTPVLLHTDLIVVDEKLEVIQPSFMAAMNSNFDRTELKDALIQNIITGCTTMYNRALADRLLRAPEYCVMHDWFLMLAAAAFGVIDHLNTGTILYRQHAGNVIGAKDVRTLSYMMRRLANYRDVKRAIAETYRQAASFLQCYGNDLTVQQKKLIEDYCAIPTLSKIGKWRSIRRLKVYKNGFWRNVAYFIFV